MKMTIQQKASIFMQNIVTTWRGYKDKEERQGKFYERYLNFYSNYDYSDKEHLQREQNHELQRLIRYAAANSPFYQEFYKGIPLEDIQTVQDLEKLPILDKKTLQQNLETMYTIKEKDGVVRYTNNTSGKPLKYIHTYKGIQLQNAFLDQFRRHHGFVNGEMKKASFEALELTEVNEEFKIFWRDNQAMKQRLYSSDHCQEAHLSYYLENLNQYKPVALEGSPSVLYELAHYINRQEIELSFQPVAIFPTSESLLPGYREEIEKAFNCKVYNHYESSEGVPLVVECSEGQLHHHILSGVIEQDEEKGTLITSFINDGTPLIRYRIEDTIELEHPENTCACGSAFPLVKELHRRTSPAIPTHTHGKVVPVFRSLFKNI